MIGAEPIDGQLPTPGLSRRLACLVYEGMLLLGVLVVAGFVLVVADQLVVATSLQQQTSASVVAQPFIFFVAGTYFAWFWSHGGQTLAMKTWRIRVTTLNGSPLSPARAWARYVLSWTWFLPALATAHFAGIQSKGGLVALVVAGVLIYATTALAHPRRQFLHDALCRTQLVLWHPVVPTRS